MNYIPEARTSITNRSRGYDQHFVSPSTLKITNKLFQRSQWHFMTKSVPVASKSLPKICNLFEKRATTWEALGYHLALTSTKQSKCRVLSKEGVLVSCGYCDKLPQNWWLGTTEMCSLTVLKARSPKSKCQQATFPMEALGRICFLPLPVSGGLHSSTCGYISPISASVITLPHSPLCISKSPSPFLL